ncbi:hydroxysqualene dehydroxylase HpnE [Duganella sp. Root1480D1]|uniref:hydroxysqualene dehydroxylase HpnE n=1 Tax=Duganella sp. Root1480D1 TaxID=1736471 RepID=UPI000710341D|nr:hydroxysqualene dehydroxylase HpnE [Duganella sp. Root1480D1]KQZ28000.1 phytoene dehydrogenase [Duganella sp. Root1480D1]
MAKHFAVVGGGWAGFAAAVELVRAGHQATVFEAARTLGGRARRVSFDGRELDNGQHIMLGAYSESLRIMRAVGVDLRSAVLTLPLQMRYPPAGGGMDFVAPRLPAPLHVSIALLRARGLERADKMALARFTTTARWMDWRLNNDCSVAELLVRFDQTPRLVALMWRPLCLAALNTPPERASAQVFLAVLRDSLGARRAASDMLVPRADLSALFPEAAASWLQGKGNTIHLGAKVTALRPAADGWTVEASGAAVGGDWSGKFAGVVLAASPAASASLLGVLRNPGAGGEASPPAGGFADLASQLAAFEPEPITTCYLQYPPGTRLEIPFYALIDDPATQRWGQFVFDRGQLDARQDGLFTVVISASSEAASLSQDALTAAIASQLAVDLARPELARPSWSKVITEKRATYACTPGLKRPPNETQAKGLVLAGDYTAGEYPATLEMAIRSGVRAAGLLAKAKP